MISIYIIMPKTNLRGGNKRKKGKNGATEMNRPIDFAKEGQIYGQVSKTVGGRRFIVTCFETDPKGDFILSEKLCHVCGKMRKKVWINEQDIVLLSIRDFDKSKGDIIHRYNNDESRILKKQSLIPNVELVKGKVEENNDINFDFNDEIPQKIQKEPKKDEPYLVLDMSDSEEIDEL